MQSYKKLEDTATTTVKQALLDHEDNINAIRSSNSGDAFPTENLVVGLKCYRTDLKQEYVYNGSSWDKSGSGDISITYATDEDIDNLFKGE